MHFEKDLPCLARVTSNDLLSALTTFQITNNGYAKQPRIQLALITAPAASDQLGMKDLLGAPRPVTQLHLAPRNYK
jgi:hypothetical protein